MLQNAQIQSAEAIAEVERRPQRKMPVGRRFQPGQSGNPGGLRSNGKRHRQLFADLEAELGGNLTATERMLLDQAVDLSLRRSKDDAAAVKCANAAARILLRLRGDRAKAQPTQTAQAFDNHLKTLVGEVA